jgi:hypothetical protein
LSLRSPKRSLRSMKRTKLEKILRQHGCRVEREGGRHTV